nr:hypothetical protein CFP56_02274 [Quercus suber]
MWKIMLVIGFKKLISLRRAALANLLLYVSSSHRKVSFQNFMEILSLIRKMRALLFGSKHGYLPGQKGLHFSYKRQNHHEILEAVPSGEPPNIEQKIGQCSTTE